MPIQHPFFVEFITKLQNQPSSLHTLHSLSNHQT